MKREKHSVKLGDEFIITGWRNIVTEYTGKVARTQKVYKTRNLGKTREHTYNGQCESNFNRSDCSKTDCQVMKDEEKIIIYGYCAVLDLV